jgi:hypothetical protein
MFSYQQTDKDISSKKILKDNGILFLKCFSDKELMQEGPYKFSQQRFETCLVNILE